MIFERRFEEWSITHPKRWIPATDRESVAEFISNQTEKIVSAQLKAADRIIVSQDRIASGIDKVAVGVDRVADGLEGLASAFEWGFSEMVWQLEQQRTILEEILKVLQAPLDTQAKELKKRAENAYWNGWIDDALEDFLESEKKNKYDFTIYQSLGNIYFFHKKRPWKALEYYEKATKYASPESSYHTSIALLHVGLIKYFACDFQGAYEATSKTIELSPNLYEAYYQRAQYCANLGKYDEAIENLQKAIEGDRNYCLKVDSEKDFDVMREQLQSFFEDLRNEAQSQAKEEIDKVQELIIGAESSGFSVDGKFSEAVIKLRVAKKKQDEAKEFLRRASLFDCWDAIDKAYAVQKMALDSLDNYFSDEISMAEREYHGKEKELERKVEFWVASPFWIVGAVFAFLLLATIVVGFIEGGIGGGILRAMFTLTIGVLGAGISTFVVGGILHLFSLGIANLIRGSLINKYKANYESKFAKLQDNLSVVHAKRIELGIEERTEDMENVDRYKDFLQELYYELPKDLQETGYSEENARNIQEICIRNGVVDSDTQFEVAKYTGFVMLGLLPPNEFQKALEEGVKLNKAVAKQIAREINNSVFLAVKASLEVLYKRRITQSMTS